MRGLGIIQTRILRHIGDEVISMSALRSRIYPADWNKPYIRKAFERAVNTLVGRGILRKLDHTEDPDKRNGRRVLLEAVLSACNSHSSTIRHPNDHNHSTRPKQALKTTSINPL